MQICENHTMNQRWLESYFTIFNAGLFDGKLDGDIKVRYEDLTDTECVGYFDPHDGVSGTLGVSNELSQQACLRVLVHEMIHAWDYAQRGFTCHDQIFDRKAQECSVLLGWQVS